MRKRTLIYYDEMDVKKIVRDELEKAKSAWLKDFTNIVARFKDEVMTKIDKFAGDIQDKRDEQTLHQGQHDDITEILDKHDLRLKKLEQTTA